MPTMDSNRNYRRAMKAPRSYKTTKKKTISLKTSSTISARSKKVQIVLASRIARTGQPLQPV